MIPKILHCIWIPLYFSKMPEVYRKGLEKFRKKLPDWDIIVHNEVSCVKAVRKYPEIWEIYKNAPKPIHKVDIARLCIVNQYGGFYMDLGMYLQKSLNEINDPSHDLIIFSEQDLDPEGKKNQGIRIYNSVFGSSSNSPYLRLCLDIIKERFRSNIKKFSNDAIWGTGPDVVSTALYYIDPSYTLKGGLSVYDDRSIRKKVFDKHNEVNKIFIHRGLGSWKKKIVPMERFHHKFVKNKSYIVFILLGIALVLIIILILILFH